MVRAVMDLSEGDKVTVTFMNKYRTFRVPNDGRYAIVGGEIEVNGEHIINTEPIDAKEPGLHKVSGAV